MNFIMVAVLLLGSSFFTVAGAEVQVLAADQLKEKAREMACRYREEGFSRYEDQGLNSNDISDFMRKLQTTAQHLISEGNAEDVFDLLRSVTEILGDFYTTIPQWQLYFSGFNTLTSLIQQVDQVLGEKAPISQAHPERTIDKITAG